MDREKIIRDWYWGNDADLNDAIHWEILKYIRMRSTDFLGEQRENGRIGDRFHNIGRIGELKKLLTAKYRKEDSNPLWGMFATVQYVRHTNRISREEFVEEMNSNKSYSELAKMWGTKKKVVKSKEKDLENRELGKYVDLSANLEEHWSRYKYDGTPYDLVLDIDGDKVVKAKEKEKEKEKTETDIKEMVEASYREAEKVKSFFDGLNVPYILKYSGKTGFHFEIPREFIKDRLKEPFTVAGRRFMLFLRDETGAVLDPKIYSEKRIWRVPYSVHQDSGLVCLPLTDSEFDSFLDDFPKNVYPPRVRRVVDPRERGLNVRNGRVNKLMKEFERWMRKKEEEIKEEEGERKREEREKEPRLDLNKSKEYRITANGETLKKLLEGTEKKKIIPYRKLKEIKKSIEEL